MSSRHLITRVWEHLNFKSLQGSAIKDHILSCEKCSNNRFDENNFVIFNKIMRNLELILNKLLKDEKHQTRVLLLLELVRDAYLTANRTWDL